MALNWAEIHVSSRIRAVGKHEQAENFQFGLPGLAPLFPTPNGGESGHGRQPPAVLTSRGGPSVLGPGQPAY